MKKISLYLLIFTMLYCLCACGKNSDAKSNSREDDGRKEQKIIISSIQVASNTKVMRAKVFLPNVKSLEETNYWLGGLDTTSKVDVIDTGDGIQINVCGFIPMILRGKIRKYIRDFNHRIIQIRH